MENNRTFQAAIRYATGLYFPRIADAPTPAFIAARKVLSPGFFDKRPAQALLQSAEPQKPYKQKPLITKQRTRATRLKTLILRKTPLFFFEQYQQAIVENPEYYGVCILESEEVCASQPWPAPRLASAREGDRPRERATRSGLVRRLVS